MALVSAYVLERFNNYFNRKVKGFSYIQEYLLNQTDNNLRYNLLNNGALINFDPRDGITTTQIVNEDFEEEGWFPDYMIIVGANASLGYDLVGSRWFIVECRRTRKSQYELYLRRDVIAEFWDKLVDAPIYVEKAHLQPDNPLIFNSEGLSLNQIKKSETLLKDETNMAWIVGYISRNGSIQDSKTISINADVSSSELTTLGISLPSTNAVFQGNQSIALLIYYQNRWQGLRIITDYLFNYINYELYRVPQTQNDDMVKITNVTDLETLIPYIVEGIVNNNLPTYFRNVVDDYDGPSVVSNNANEFLRSADNKVWTDLTNYGTLHTSWDQYVHNTSHYSNVNGAESINVCNTLSSKISDYNTAYTSSVSLTNGFFVYDYTYKYIDIWKVDFNPGTLNVDVPLGRQQLNDAPYDMFCIPYCQDGDIDIYDPGNNQVIGTASNSYALKVAQMIGSFGEGSNAIIYDLQLLPYCPIPDIMDNNRLQIIGNAGTEYSLVTETIGEDTTNVQVIYYCQSSNFTKTINLNIAVNETKIENECDLYRLCSPNYQGIFEFSVAKNGGLNYINIDCTYKPFTPYIHLNPNFGRLYGQDFNDARGLILGGDFSIAIVSDAWKTYEINNKNYQNMFDREIQSMDYLRKFERIEGVAGAIAGTTQGAVMGSAFGNIPGAVAGGVASALGGVADIAISESRYKESVNYKTDMYNFQLGNIKALPYSLTKSAAQNYNNKLFPFLEYYTCTDAEKEAVRQKIKYNGMTVMAIGTINDYITIDDYHWFQGQLIRIESIAEDTHVIDAIYDELKKGVFINGLTISN